MTENETIVHRFYDVFTSGNTGEFDRILAEDWRALPPVPNNPAGREGQKQTLRMLHEVLGEVNYKVEETIVAGDRVTSRAVLSGIHKGMFLGIPPTNRRLEMMTIEIHRIADGKIVETWHIEDFFGAVQQLTA